MSLNGSVRIAGRKTAADWTTLKPSLQATSKASDWAAVFERFFLARLRTRYLGPIDALHTMKKSEGEGFSVVTIQCCLIEFLAASIKGVKYRRRKKGEPPLDLKFEYGESGKLFTDFLQAEAPFKGLFPTATAAQDFYDSVRCGLVHEARTKGGWKIWRTGGLAIDSHQKVVRYPKLQDLLDEYVSDYGKRLQSQRDLQEAFIRVFDGLCQP